jgi:hypothetical protein
MEIVFVVRERRWLDTNGIYAALARGRAPTTVRTTRLRRSTSGEMRARPRSWPRRSFICSG